MEDIVKFENKNITLLLRASECGLKSIEFIDNSMNVPIGTNNTILQEASKQLIEYFDGKRQLFDIPLDINGTVFQQKVWKELAKIQYGTTISYKSLAIKCGGSNYARAVAMANSKNQLPIIIPCHRVIASSGELGGYSGGIENKNYLLETEHII